MKIPHLAFVGAFAAPVLVLGIQNFDWWYNAQLFQSSARPVQQSLADVLWNDVYWGPAIAAGFLGALLGFLWQRHLDEMRDMAEVNAYLEEKRSKPQIK